MHNAIAALYNEIALCPSEVKSGKNYKRHRALNKALSTENYGIGHAVVLHEGNVEQEGGVSYLPAYMVMCVKPEFQGFTTETSIPAFTFSQASFTFLRNSFITSKGMEGKIHDFI